jgi:hypothetical protein
MNLPEGFLAENLDEIIRRSTLRLEQESVHVGMLQEGGNQHISAKATLKQRKAALGRLKAYRAKFDYEVVLDERHGKQKRRTNQTTKYVSKHL